MRHEDTAADPLPADTLAGVLHHQRLLWQKRQKVRVEDLLSQFPKLQPDKDLVLDLINHEIVLRTEFDAAPGREEYFQRFPEYRADLAVLFDVHNALEQETDTMLYERCPAEATPGLMPELPNFVIQEILGQGGMGVVYKATDLRLKRTVALKMIRGSTGGEERQRFQSEAEAVAKLDHPHIVQIFEVGEYHGHPYIALEYADGGTLVRLLQGEPQAPAMSAQLVETLARAVHYANGQGIIHRDLKPGNILLQQVHLPPAQTMPAGLVVKDKLAYLPKIADFGLAKVVEPDSTASQTQAIVGTPSYMAPEQAGEHGRKIGPPADVHALGAILYEMLTGRPPFRGETALETLDQVRKMDPVAPCRLQPRCPRDLETICLKCLKKEPGERYPRASDLADDLGRFLRHEPIHARPTSSVEHLRLWCRRNPRLAWLSAALVLVTVLGIAAVTWQWQRAARGEASARAHLYVSQINLSQRHWQDGQCRRLDQVLGALREPAAGLRGLCDFEWYYLKGLLHKDLVRAPAESCVAYSPDGKWLATAGAGNTLRLWSAGGELDAQPLRQWAAHAQEITSLAFGPQGTVLVSGSIDRTARVWRVADGSLLTTLAAHPSEITSVACDPATGSIATACRDGSIRLWEPDGSPRLVLEAHAGPVNQVAFSLDGMHLASAGDDFTVRLWEVATGEVLHALEGHKDVVLTVAFAPDGKTLLSGGWDRVLRAWDAGKGQLLRSYPALPHWIQRIAFRPDGKRFAAACWDHSIQVWETEPSAKKAQSAFPLVIRGHFERVLDVAWHPKEPRLASVSKDRTLRIWNPERRPDAQSLELTEFCKAFALHPNQPVAAIATNAHTVKLCNLEHGTARTLPAPGDHVQAVAFSADGRWLAAADKDQKIRLWHFPSGELAHELNSQQGAVNALAFHPKTHHLASAGKDGTVRLWDPHTGKEIGRANPHTAQVYCLAFSADGRWLVSGSADKAVHVWNVERQHLERAVTEIGAAVFDLVVAPDGRQLAVATKEATIALWDWRSGTLVQSLDGHAGRGHHLAFSHSGKRLASGGGDGTVKLWDLITGQELLTLKAHEREVLGVAFDKLDQTLVSVGNGVFNGQARVWDSRAGKKAAAE